MSKSYFDPKDIQPSESAKFEGMSEFDQEVQRGEWVTVGTLGQLIICTLMWALLALVLLS